MRRILRRPLTQSTLDKLAEITELVAADPDPKAKANAKWEGKPKKPFAEIREQLEDMAPGRARCMYCEDSLGTDIEHFWPKGDYPARAFDWLNYLLACSHCNSNLKRTQFPLDAKGGPLLVDPTAEDPAEHLLFLPTSGRFRSVGSKGGDTIRVFGLNDDSSARRLPNGRKDALIVLTALLTNYDRVLESDPAGAAEIRHAALGYPFSTVVHWLVATAARPGAAAVLGSELVGLIQTHGVATWL